MKQLSELSELSVENLERTSNNWDKTYKQVLVFISGGSDMWGGHCRLAHLSIQAETGKITVDGVATSGYNIARGANGESCQTMCYYKGVQDFNDIQDKTPTYSINITGNCSGAEEAMCSILSAKLDWIIK